jgi:hypothetical protein
MYFNGELRFDNKPCNVNFQQVPMTFLEDDKFSQLIFSESALSCIFNTLSASNHGNIHWNQHKYEQFFVGTDRKLDTQAFGAQIGAIKRKYGTKTPKPMVIGLGFHDFDVKIGQFDTDIISTLVVKLSLSLEDGPELIYDELKVVLSANVNAKNDFVFPQLINLKIIRDNDLKQGPIRNSLQMTAPEYREFISVTGFFFNYLKKYFNEVYSVNGLQFPYTVDELDTELVFENKLMYVMIDMTERFAKILEEDFWRSDKDPRPN